MFTPDLILNRITDLTPDILKQLKVRAMILDVDNTLSTHGNPIPYEGVTEWLAQMKNSGFSMIISSNNFAKRVAPFAQSLGLPFISMSCKPFPFGLNRAIKQFSVQRSEIAIVGDQVFTDILGGNLVGIQTILVEPIEAENGFLFQCKRFVERPFIWLYYRKRK